MSIKHIKSIKRVSILDTNQKVILNEATVEEYSSFVRENMEIMFKMKSFSNNDDITHLIIIVE